MKQSLHSKRDDRTFYISCPWIRILLTFCSKKQHGWQRKTSNQPTRGFADDGEDVPQANRRTAAQKVTHLELMLGQIANFCPVVARNTIVKNSTSMQSITTVKLSPHWSPHLSCIPPHILPTFAPHSPHIHYEIK